MSPPPRITDDDYLRGLDMKVLRRIWALLRPYRWSAAWLGTIMVGFALMESVVPLLSKLAIDRFAVPRQTEGLIGFALLCLLVALGRGLANIGMIATGGKINTHVRYDLRKLTFEHLQKLSFAYFDRRPVGQLLSRMTSDAETIGQVLSWGIVDTVDGCSRMLIMSIIMFSLDARLGAIVLCVVPPLVLVIVRFQRVTLRMQRDVRRLNSDITAAFNEGITGALTTKTLVREDASLAEFRERTGPMFATATRTARFSALYLPVVMLIGAIGSALALWAGGDGVIAGTVTYGTLVAFLSYAVAFFQPLQDIARRFPMLQSAQAAAERIYAVLETEPKILDTPQVAARYSHGTEPAPLTGAVRFQDVCFHYVDNEPVLEDFSLDVAPGEIIALVGETGAGKTTVVNLLSRFYEPTAGAIHFDGIDMRELPLAWFQRQFGIVQQTPHLFSGTIADNIRYGRLDASDADIRRAASLVGADSFVAALPEGYQTPLGEGGGSLSTGQKQLVSLARVLLADPAILVLDEATSSIDTETEALIQQGIATVLQGRTSFIVAHRLSTIRAANRILFISGGRILEQGTHHELIQMRGAYYRLYTSQFVAEREDALLRHIDR